MSSTPIPDPGEPRCGSCKHGPLTIKRLVNWCACGCHRPASEPYKKWGEDVPDYFFKSYPDVPRDVLIYAWMTAEKRDYSDSFRFAKAGDPDQVAAYEKAREDGCCGSFDDLVWVDGKLWLYGFQYGH